MRIVASYPTLVVGAVIALVIGAAELVGSGSPVRAVVSAAIVVAYALVITLLGRRHETVSVLAGRPVDERWEHINLEACAWALGVSGIVILGAFVIADATGGEWAPYAFMGAVIAVTYVGSLLILRLRH